MLLAQSVPHRAHRRVVIIVVRISPHRRVRHPGADTGRLDAGDADAQRRNLFGNDLGKASHGPFRALIGRQAGSPDPVGQRRDLDDVTEPLLAQYRQYSPGHIDHTAEVHVDLGVENFGWHVLDQRQVRLTRVVYHHIQASERVERRGDRTSRARRVSDVQGHRANTLSIGSDGAVEGCGVPSRGDNDVSSSNCGVDDPATRVRASFR